MYSATIARVLILSCVASGVALGQKQVRNMSSFALIEDQSKQTDAANPQSVEDIVNITIARSVFPTVPDALKAQLKQAQIAYMNTQLFGVTDNMIADAVNDAGTRLEFPKFTKTNPQQVFVFKMLLLPAMPDFLAVRFTSLSTTRTAHVSPLAAWFIASLLLEQKLSNPDFQREADEWSADAIARKADKSKPVVTARLVATPNGDMLITARRFRSSLNSQLQKTSTPETIAVAKFAAHLIPSA